MNAAQIAAAREWVEDCGASTAGRTDAEIIAAVDRHHHSGIAGFIAEAGTDGSFT